MLCTKASASKQRWCLQEISLNIVEKSRSVVQKLNKPYISEVSKSFRCRKRRERALPTLITLSLIGLYSRRNLSILEIFGFLE
ncbi:unnamed protein product [Moneuplotes crassus]|uniref:Uncharacterized protein n=1 Tax=Euplotes crassus TaxID=5936 RepID=A0AAD1U7P3_EUPCR|nr:unnamed protein product [Moneuplotes crassus]